MVCPRNQLRIVKLWAINNRPLGMLEPGEGVPHKNLWTCAVRKSLKSAVARMSGSPTIAVSRTWASSVSLSRQQACAAEATSGPLAPHSFRVTAITDLLELGDVMLNDVQYLAGHTARRDDRLYDRRQKQVTRNIVERISI